MSRSHARSQGFWNFMAKRYAKSPVEDQAAYERKLEMTRSHLSADMEVLEFGCGTGTTALIHVPHVAHIQAIDYSRAMIDIARGKAAADAVTNVDFDVSTIEEWRAPDASYDLIQAHSILHLVQDLDAVLAKVRKLIKPGGRFISSTACIGEMPGIARVLLPVGGALRLLPYLSMFKAQELEAAIKRAGFEIEHQWRPRKAGSVFIIAVAV